MDENPRGLTEATMVTHVDRGCRRCWMLYEKQESKKQCTTVSGEMAYDTRAIVGATGTEHGPCARQLWSAAPLQRQTNCLCLRDGYTHRTRRGALHAGAINAFHVIGISCTTLDRTIHIGRLGVKR